MSDRYIEKSFLYLFLLSLVIHSALAIWFLFFKPQEHREYKQQPLMVDLHDLPELKNVPAKEKPAKRLAEKRQRVAKETAPKGTRERDLLSPPPIPPRMPVRPVPATPPVASRPKTPQAPAPESTTPAPPRKGEMVVREPAGKGAVKQQPGNGVKQPNLPDLAHLFPSASKLAKIEENYRKKYGPEVADGDTHFLNTDDILFGSFLRRFETAVYGVWRYPEEAARLGIEGVTPVKITFNRKGEITRVQILGGPGDKIGSGSKILDDEVKRTLKEIGPMGSFPRGYDKDEFNLIAFFQYGLTSGSGRGIIH